MTLRQDKRRWTMREVQGAALDLFEARGFDAVSVEAIAAAAGVSPPTVYRHFGSKERIVLWDDYDPGLFAEIAAQTRALAPLAAIEHGLIASLDRVYADDARLVLRRARLMLSNPALLAANAPLMAELCAALGALLDQHYPRLGTERAELLGAVVVAALEIAIKHWIAEEGRRPLREHFREAFADLRSVVLTEGVLT
ncbi:MAG: TetR family transcriptional regulator [Devosia sp.]